LKVRRRLDTSVARVATSAIGIAAEACGAGTFCGVWVFCSPACATTADMNKKLTTKAMTNVLSEKRISPRSFFKVILFDTFLTHDYKKYIILVRLPTPARLLTLPSPPAYRQAGAGERVKGLFHFRGLWTTT
jgi:hypothetical protein